mgnify:FL=1
MEFTHEYMKENCGCYEIEKLLSCSFMKSESVSLQSIIESEIPIKDKFWFLCKKVLTKDENKKVAIELAKSVLSIYENKYPEDYRPRKAIESAKSYLEGKITKEELIEFRKAAYAAAAAAYAAAAYADADAAAAAAADAAYAAYAAAAAAAYAAADAAADADAAAAAAAAAYAAAAYAAYVADAAVAADQFEIIKKYSEKYY